ncbi:hypothetical protein IE53DRAFT_387726 [Violaceomyces palustris]|uniref:Uncharacterized protein n=1 Tax=Violaceomyces palustris TaxID=1673888 RepID=A0ACD0NWA5_9BASI|nr:hypothetical protein IE53DRAFT_387726 [Violaceomyces palustris]
MTAATYAGHLSNGDGLLASKGHKPTHDGLFKVVFAQGSFTSHLEASTDFQKGQTITFMSPHASSSKIVSYSTVQVGEQSHIELNSDLLYCNHSCDPNVRFDVSGDNLTWAAIAEKNINKGDVLTFFYPSTEWNMAQPFNCNCSTSKCLNKISGASHIPSRILKDYFLNAHIVRLKRDQIEQGQGLEALETGETKDERIKAFLDGRQDVLNRPRK